MTEGVIRSPARLCSRDGNICFYGRLEHDFLAFLCFALILSFLIQVCLSSSCSFVQQSSATLSKYVFYSTYFLVSFDSCLILEFLCFYSFSIFRSSYFSGGVFCCALVPGPGTLALGLPTLILSRLFVFSVSLYATTKFCISPGRRQWGYC